jgi:hypothetical protein
MPDVIIDYEAGDYLRGHQLWSDVSNSQHFMKPEGSLSQELSLHLPLSWASQ